MNVEIGAEAALFPEKEYMYINGIAVAVQGPQPQCLQLYLPETRVGILSNPLRGLM
jgi:hypothetical protein